jgi:hypothetical protein
MAAPAETWVVYAASAGGNLAGLSAAALWGRAVTAQDVVGIAILNAAVAVLVWGGIQVRRRHRAAMTAHSPDQAP